MARSDASIFVLPGRGKIRVVISGTTKHHAQSGISKTTPEWMVSFDDVLSAHIPVEHSGDTKGVELIGFSQNTSRETVGHAVSQLIADSAVRWSDLIVIIQHTTSGPVLESMMNNGTLIKDTRITRWGWIRDSLALIEERIFKDCFITQFRQILDDLVLFIRYESVDERVYIFDQKGNAVGKVSSVLDAVTGLTSQG